MIVILLIAYDPLNILDLTQKVIVVVMTIVLLPLLLIRRQRLLKKMEKQLEQPEVSHLG